MACGSGCCGGPPPKPAVEATAEALAGVQEPVQALPNDNDNDNQSGNNNCRDSCCDQNASVSDKAIKNESAGAEDGRCKASQPTPTNCEAACCSGLSNAAKDSDTCNAEPADDCYAPKPVDTDCDKGCCSKPAPAEPPDDCCAPKPVDTDCGKGCCSKPAPAEPADDCCAPKSVDADCGKGCCSKPAPPELQDLDDPSCCKGKSFPCCDTSCLDRLALRECTNQKDVTITHEDKRSTGQCSYDRGLFFRC